MIDDIIRLSELDEGAEMPCEDVSLKVLSEEVCETLADAAKLKNVSLEVTGDEGIVNGRSAVDADTTQNMLEPRWNAPTRLNL